MEITTRKEAEQVVRQIEIRYFKLLESSTLNEMLAWQTRAYAYRFVDMALGKRTSIHSRHDSHNGPH